MPVRDSRTVIFTNPHRINQERAAADVQFVLAVLLRRITLQRLGALETTETSGQNGRPLIVPWALGLSASIFLPAVSLFVSLAFLHNESCMHLDGARLFTVAESVSTLHATSQ